jgi:Fic family protein
MRLPRKPPTWTDVFRSDPSTIIEAMVRPETAEFVRKANDKYLHWDRLRYYPIPEGLDLERAWCVVKISRSGQRQVLPISFQDLHQRLNYWTPPRHLEWLHQIDLKAGGGISSPSSQPLANDERYLFSSLMEEAIASSQLEGASTTRRVAKQMLRSGRKPRNGPERMIANNYQAILEIRERRNERLTPDMLCQLQGMLTRGTLDNRDAEGQFRRPGENVVVEDRLTHEVLHTPPDARSLDERLRQICEFANHPPKLFVHPVIRAIALHFALGFVHPFVDGNGRTARAIFYWFMLRHGYWLFEYLPISRIFIVAPSKYARAYLYTETDEGDVTYFIHYNLQVILRAVRELHDYVARQQKELRELAALINAHGGLNHRQAALLNEAMRHPDRGYTIQYHQGLNHVTYATARSDLLGLVEAGLFTKTTEGKRGIFFPVTDLARRLDGRSRSGRPADDDTM